MQSGKRWAINRIKLNNIITRLRELQIEQEELTIQQENLLSELEEESRGVRVELRSQTDPPLTLGTTVFMKSKERLQGETGIVIKLRKSRATVQVVRQGIVSITTRNFKTLQLIERANE